MSYTLTWYKPEQVLFLALEDEPSLEELKAINQKVVDTLEKHQVKLGMLIDASRMQVGYRTSNHLRDTQDYMNHPLLDYVYIIADDKLNRLVTLMAFCMARAQFLQFNTMEVAESTLQRRGLST